MSGSARGIHHFTAQSIPEKAQMQTCWLLTKQTDCEWVENIDGTVDSTLLIHKDGVPFLSHGWLEELPIFSLACAHSLSLSEIYEMYNLHLSTMCWTAELHMTCRNTTYSGEVLSIDLASRKLLGNFRLPRWPYALCSSLVSQDIPPGVWCT